VQTQDETVTTRGEQPIGPHAPVPRARRLREYILKDVLSVARRWSWRRRRDLAHGLRRAELRVEKRRGSHRPLTMTHVPLERLLLGEDNGLPAVDVARLTGALLAPSTPAPEWPLVVAAANPHDEAAFARLESVAHAHIARAGHYYGRRSTAELREFVRLVP
jgi:hypothetical protein